MIESINLKKNFQVYNFNIEIDSIPFQKVKEMQKLWLKSK